MSRHAFLALMLITACTSITTFETEGSTGDAVGPGTTTSGLTGAMTGETPGSTTAETSSSSSGGVADSGIDDTGCDFVGCGPDVPPIETCDIWNDDCPRGEKCTWWANDGGATPNSTRCVPLDPDPAAPGEPCTAEGLGFDDCAAGSMCFELESYPRGVCVAFCVGTPEAPGCAEETSLCSVSGGGLGLCLPGCDPLGPTNCPEGQGCYPDDPRPVCGPDASGDGGGPFEPCEVPNACDPGSTCAPAATVGACLGDSPACCTPYCDLSDPSDQTCPRGTHCVPLYDDDGPPGYEDVGICGTP